MILAGLGIGGVAFGLSVLGLNFLPWFVVVALVFGGACFIAAYLAHARHTENPALDLTLFRLPTFFASVVGGFIFRLGLGALPFLLPLMLQIGFGMTPFQSGMITFATALGAMGMKWAVVFILRRFGFRNILVVNSVISAAFLAICAGFTATTPIAADDGPALRRRVFPFVAIHQHQHHRLCRSGTPARRPSDGARQRRPATVRFIRGRPGGHGGGTDRLHPAAADHCRPRDFPPAFLAVAAISALSALIFARLAPDAGAEMADRLPTPRSLPTSAPVRPWPRVAPRNPVANRYNSAESVRLAGGLTCFTLL